MSLKIPAPPVAFGVEGVAAAVESTDGATGPFRNAPESAE